MFKRAGYMRWDDPDGGTQEADAFTCGHCQKIVTVPAMTAPSNIGGMCKQCMKLVCPGCVAKRTCTPWEKQMDAMERRERLHREMRG